MDKKIIFKGILTTLIYTGLITGVVKGGLEFSDNCMRYETTTTIISENPSLNNQRITEYKYKLDDSVYVKDYSSWTVVDGIRPSYIRTINSYDVTDYDYNYLLDNYQNMKFAEAGDKVIEKRDAVTATDLIDNIRIIEKIEQNLDNEDDRVKWAIFKSILTIYVPMNILVETLVLKDTNIGLINLIDEIKKSKNELKRSRNQ